MSQLNFLVILIFIGHIYIGETVISCKDLASNATLEEKLDVKCLRKKRVIDKIFTASTATLVAIIYINFGCVVQWPELKNLIKKPVGPAIGFFGQFIIMPLVRSLGKV